MIQVGWVITHLADVESDFSASHHIHIDIDEGEFTGLSSARFFRLAERLPAYPGVLQAKAMAEIQEQQEREGGAPGQPHRAPGGPDGRGGFGDDVKVIPLTPDLAGGGMAALGLGDLVEYSTG